MKLRRSFSLAAAAGALLVTGCNGQATTPTAPALVFTGAPALTVASASGQLSIDVWWSPAAPTVGYDAAQLSITDATGAPIGGLTLTIVPWMPAHGHGASVEPAVSEISPGRYVATPIDFFMAGSWELMTAIARSAQGDDGGSGDASGSGGASGSGEASGAHSAGAINDSAEPTVDVP
jgi:YtkA-like